jgi:DNA modification methylase
MPLDDLVPADYNPRTISEAALKGLSNSVDRFGLVEPVVWNKRTKRVVGGHQRLKVLRSRGDVETDVVVVDLPAGEEKALNVALNNPHIAGDFTEGLQDILGDIKTEMPDLFDDLRLNDLWVEPERSVSQDEVPDPPTDPVTTPGDLWELGRHRLVCGDSTSADDVAKALGGLDPFLMVTDPPYGVNYDPGWRDSLSGRGSNKGSIIENDHRSGWRDAISLFPGAVVYLWHAAWFAAETNQSLKDSGFQVRSQIVWSKPSLQISRGHYHWQHEPCWYAVRNGATAKWAGDRKQSTIWGVEIIRGPKRENHSNQKPVELMARPIRNHGAPGDVVYDPFLGSGTTMVAAEQLDRACLGLEISPAYCDVIVERWQNLTGEKAKRSAK